MGESIKRILITGGAGFVGYHLAHSLSQDKNNYLLLVDNFTRSKLDEDLQALLSLPNVNLLSCDLTHPESFEQLGSGYDEVYHLAAILGVRNVLERPHEVLRVNAVSTLLLLQWFSSGGAKKLLYSSTSEAYAWTQQFYGLQLPTPEDVPLALTDLKDPRTSYAASKIFSELAVTQYCKMANKPFVIVRYHNIYGPRMGREHVIPELYCRALEGENPLVVYSASHSRSFCYVRDAVVATISAMRASSADGHTINVGNDHEEITIGELAKLILKKANIRAHTRPNTARNDPIARRCPDLTRAKQLLGYEPTVGLDAGLEKTIQWYKYKLTTELKDAQA